MEILTRIGLKPQKNKLNLYKIAHRRFSKVFQTFYSLCFPTYIFLCSEFAESYESLWEQFCERITELNEQSVSSIAQAVTEAARLEDETKTLQEEIIHTQSVTSSLASKLLPEQ